MIKTNYSWDLKCAAENRLRCIFHVDGVLSLTCLITCTRVANIHTKFARMWVIIRFVWILFFKVLSSLKQCKRTEDISFFIHKQLSQQRKHNIIFFSLIRSVHRKKIWFRLQECNKLWIYKKMLRIVIKTLE